jgi:hypothetical protein
MKSIDALANEMRPAEQPEALSVDAKLIEAQAALAIVRDAADPSKYPPNRGKRWSQRDRLENALRRIPNPDTVAAIAREVLSGALTCPCGPSTRRTAPKTRAGFRSRHEETPQ